MKLIINADDFGYSPGQNLGIIKAHANGIVTSTTCLANAPYLDNALFLAKSYPNLGGKLELKPSTYSMISPT